MFACVYYFPFFFCLKYISVYRRVYIYIYSYLYTYIYKYRHRRQVRYYIAIDTHTCMIWATGETSKLLVGATCLSLLSSFPSLFLSLFCNVWVAREHFFSAVFLCLCLHFLQLGRTPLVLAQKFCQKNKEEVIKLLQELGAKEEGQ